MHGRDFKNQFTYSLPKKYLQTNQFNWKTYEKQLKENVLQVSTLTFSFQISSNCVLIDIRVGLLVSFFFMKTQQNHAIKLVHEP